MSINFKIFIHRNSENIHLKLIGDFDGSSAHELIHVIGKNGDYANKIFIHTNSLENIHPFGCDVFKKNIKSLNGISNKLIFSGDNPIHIGPIRRKAS